MLDAGTVGETLAQGQTRHWLVNGVRVSGMRFIHTSFFLAATKQGCETSGSSVTNVSAVEVTGYAGPAPPAGSGPHRYVT